jgi:hypothetical protein
MGPSKAHNPIVLHSLLLGQLYFYFYGDEHISRHLEESFCSCLLNKTEDGRGRFIKTSVNLYPAVGYDTFADGNLLSVSYALYMLYISLS